ncbi:MAG TPA: lipid II flippase Amj family protein [Pyrinomonadaceae bacterium]|nr:lipid II flippase Amj family protein [Pyrinomonadaceae bacterium]
MTNQVKLVFLLTFVIHLISTLSYAVRIAGVRTGRIAVSFAIFNILVLASRTSNTFQGPLLAKHVEENILHGAYLGIEADFRWLLVASTLASVAGLLLIPTFQRLFARAIETLGTYRSVPRMMLRALSRAGLHQLRDAASIPAKENITLLTWRQAPRTILLFNALATALLTVGVFASLYAGYLRPDLRVTANNLSPVINALSTILLFMFIDPYLSLLTDDVTAGRATPGHFRRCIVLFAVSRVVGTVLAQLFLIPAAKLIAVVAEFL